jgi:TolB-like protein/Flp pilus assembly protein TadD
VAVLPFDVATGASAADAFATGLHLDVLTTLARDPALTVISRRSLARGSGPADGRALGAGTIVEGVVREEGGRVRLTVQVVDGQDGRVRWAETLDRDLSAEGAFDLQAEIADRIAETVHGEVAAPAGRPGGSPPPPDLDAYLLRTRGRVHLEQRTERGLRRALALFGEATELATESAAAWAGIAEARALLGYYGYAAPDEGPDALAAALQALELDPSSGDALRALGVVRSVRQEGPAAARAFARAVERSPGDGDAQCWLGWIRLILGEPAGAIGPSERAAELDPLAPPVRVYLAEAYLANGRAEDAVREARRAGELQPDYGLTHFTEEVALHHAGRHGDATAALGEALVLARVGGGAPGRADVEGALAVARAAAGDEEGAHLLREGLGGTGVPAALALAALGDVEGALRALDGVTEWSALATVQLRYLFPHALCRVRQDDRFDRIVDRIDAAWGRPTTASALESGRS